MSYYDWATLSHLELDKKAPKIPRTSFEIEQAGMQEDYQAHKRALKTAKAEPRNGMSGLLRRAAAALRPQSVRPQKPTSRV